MAIKQLQQDIESRLTLSPPNSSGFQYTDCPVCGRQMKGGFKFEDDKIVYNCFRASCDSSTVLTEGEYVPKKFRSLMDKIGVQIPTELLYSNSKSKTKFQSLLDSNLYERFNYKPLDRAQIKGLKRLENEKVYLDYIHNRRLPENKDYFITIGNYEWDGYLMVPSYIHNTLIGFIGRNIHNDYKKYKDLFDSNDKIFFTDSFDKSIVFVFEGFMDSLHFPNACSILGNTLNKKQAHLLSSFEDVVLVPDRDYYTKMLEAARIYGYRVSVPDWGNYKDASQAVETYGRIAVNRMLLEGIQEDIYNAEIRLKMGGI